MNFQRNLLIALAAVLLAACALASPSPTPTSPPPTPSSTARPATATLPPSTSISVPSNAPAATSTPTRPGQTPSPVVTHAASSPPAATSTVALTDTPTTEHPLIHSFTAAPAEIDPGDEVTLAWETVASLVTLCTVSRGGPLSECWEVDPTGTRVIATHDLDRIYAMYILFAESGDIKDQASATVTIRCPDTWFFDNPPDQCPYAAVLSSGAAQRFEHGLMIWVGGLDAIFVLYADDQYSPRWDRFQDLWEPGMPESDPDLVPPAGLFQPVRGFGLVWRGPEGATITVRDRLGWATGQEFAIDTAYQCDTAPKYNTCYLLGPDGIIVLKPERSGWHLYTGPG